MNVNNLTWPLQILVTLKPPFVIKATSDYFFMPLFICQVIEKRTHYLVTLNSAKAAGAVRKQKTRDATTVV